ncbi:hypothetical protein AXG93_2415s1460 [Marchantia polymorpha subsp. ruderalis]|uniref:Uncharacterized protein n=1 Tax=Marchantia polymorpha subsp. ruderalis TaxID=1480154 RepID=A0A176VUT8_MARPO|nr:hypothetical protein AXG93_2415s1460 [Marchantia polymorpha subsp. ruderalis]
MASDMWSWRGEVLALPGLGVGAGGGAGVTTGGNGTQRDGGADDRRTQGRQNEKPVRQRRPREDSGVYTVSALRSRSLHLPFCCKAFAERGERHVASLLRPSLESGSSWGKKDRHVDSYGLS